MALAASFKAAVCFMLLGSSLAGASNKRRFRTAASARLQTARHSFQANLTSGVAAGHDFAKRKGPFKYRMRYMPGHELVVCACAKCGSSSMYEFIYEQEFGGHWPYHGAPFAQTTDSSRWEGRFQEVDVQDQAAVFSEAFSFALVRDPVERIISAWKSKVACDENHTGVDRSDRSRMVPALLSLIEEEPRETCLSLDDFVRALYIAHKLGRAAELNVHFLPQDKACFAKFPADTWSKVIAISEPDSFEELAVRLHDGKLQKKKKKDVAPPKLHSSGSKQATSTVSTDTSSMLAAITASEYRMLGKFLPTFS